MSVEHQTQSKTHDPERKLRTPDSEAPQSDLGTRIAGLDQSKLLRDGPLAHSTARAFRQSVLLQTQRTQGNSYTQRLVAPGAHRSDRSTRATRTHTNGNGHSLPPIQRRQGVPAEAESETGPSEEEKAEALAAAERAEQAAMQTSVRGQEEVAQSRAAKATEQEAGKAAKQEAVTAQEQAAALKESKAGNAPGGGTGGEQPAAPAKEGAGGEKQPTPAGAEAAASAGPAAATIGPAGSNSGAIGEKAPTAPEEDPGFQAVVGTLKGVAAQQKSHAPAKAKAGAAQAAAESPASELEGKAQANQVGKMEQAETPAFDRAAFKAQLMERIASLTPQTTEEADEFKEDDKLGGVKGEMQGQVAQEQAATQGPIEETSAEAPDTGSVAPKPVKPLTPAEPGAAPAAVGAQQAVPKPRSSGEVEAPLQSNTRQIDQEMAAADVSEAQLSQDPAFQPALDSRQEARSHAQSAPQGYRQAEQAQLTQAQADATSTAQERTQAMHGDRAQLLSQVGGQQGQAKTKDEQARADVAAKIKSIYAQTRSSVETKLSGLDRKVEQVFDAGAAAAKQAFEDYVEARMEAYKQRRYGGMLGWARWLDDKITGMPAEVNAFYRQGRNLYLKKMDAVIDNVVSVIERGLTEAKAEIAKGKQRIQEYVNSLPDNLKSVGEQAAQDIQSQFDQLEQSVDDKQNQLIDTLANKYQENLQAVDARIEELKAANQGLVDKALNAVAGAIKTILELKNMLLSVLAGAADAVGNIIKNPIGFLGNLISGVKQGFQQFVNNIGTHLKKGLMTWLFGEVAKAGIELPKSFDLKGILTLVMQLLGLTWANIRAQAVKLLGEGVVSKLEGAFDIFMKIKDEGIGALWEFIQEKVGDLKEMVLGGIKEMVTTQVIQAGIQWLMGILGGPAGAFIKAAKAIYDIVMWFVNNAARLKDLVGAIIGSVSAIARGALGQAAQFIEQSLAKAIPVVIGFLANLLGLGNLGEKIRGIVEKIRAPINKAIGKVLIKAKGFASKIIGKVKGFGKKLKGKLEGSEEDKQKRLKQGVTAGVAAVNKLKGRKVTAALIKPALAALRLRYRLGVLEPVVQDGYWAVHGEVQRMTVLTGLKYTSTETVRHLYSGETEKDPQSPYAGKWDGSGIHEWQAVVDRCAQDGYKILQVKQDPITGTRRVTIKRVGTDPKTGKQVSGNISKTIYPKQYSRAEINSAGDQALDAAANRATDTTFTPYNTNKKRDGNPADGYFEASVAMSDGNSLRVQGWFKELPGGQKIITSHASRFDKSWPTVSQSEW